jgi:hypothetical protein
MTPLERARKRITELEAQAHRRNLELDAMHYVWCCGGCSTGVHRYDGRGPDAVTEDVVQEAERNTTRLRTWWEARKAKTTTKEQP